MVLGPRLYLVKHRAVTSGIVGFKPHSDSVSRLSKMSVTMVLMRIKPSRVGFELRTFQGVNRDHVDKVVSEIHSMKWISSGLRAV